MAEPMIDVRLVTCADPPVPPEETATIVPILEARGLRCEQRAWDDHAVDWRGARLTIIRSTWDYHERLAEYLEWARHVATVSTLLNDAATVRWNCHKRYLFELERAGVAVVPTELVERGDPRPLDQILEARGWSEAVVKPAVSLGARGAARVRAGEAAGRDHFRALVGGPAARDALIQPYVATVETLGEGSVVFIDGQRSHTAIKRPKPGDYRVQPRHGGSTEPCGLDTESLAMAERAQAAAPRPTLYARADLVWIDQRPFLMELELIEPALFLSICDGAAETFARAIERRLALALTGRETGS